MSKARRIEVQPVTRYRQARYPSFLDPDPILHPYPVPYPISQKLAIAIAALGLGAAAPDVCAQDPGGGAPKGHPFTVAASGLPHRTSAFGTGAPTMLRDAAARKVIEDVFRKAGYDLRKKHAIEDKDLAFIASGYDAKKKVGYVYADSRGLGADGIRHWGRPKVEDPSDAELSLASLEWRLSKSDQKRLRAAREISSRKSREKKLEALLREFESSRISLAEARILESREVKNKRFVALISPYDRRFLYYPQAELAPEEWQKAGALKGAARDRAVKKLYERAARKVLDRLAESVRDYIAWSRVHGAL